MITTMVDVAVRVLCKAWSEALSDPEAMAARAVDAALALGPRAVSGRNEISIVFADAALIRGLNRVYRGQDKPTNVLAFGIGEGNTGAPRLMGDVVLAFEPACDEASAQGKSLSDHATHLIVHGTLHLMGFDHETARQAEEMEAAEISILSALGVPDPYTPTETRLSPAPAYG